MSVATMSRLTNKELILGFVTKNDEKKSVLKVSAKLDMFLDLTVKCEVRNLWDKIHSKKTSTEILNR